MDPRRRPPPSPRISDPDRLRPRSARPVFRHARRRHADVVLATHDDRSRNGGGPAAWLERPGGQDLTAHVDFTSVRAAAEDRRPVTLGFMDQTYFLLGILLGSGAPRSTAGEPQRQPRLENAVDAGRPRQHAQGADPRQRRRPAGAARMLVPSTRHVIADAPDHPRPVGHDRLRSRDARADRAVLVVEHADCLDRLHPLCRRDRVARAPRLVDPLGAARVRSFWRWCRFRSGSCSSSTTCSSGTGTTSACPRIATLRYFGYAWSFATIWPAIFEGAELIAVVAWRRSRPGRRVDPEAGRASHRHG